MSDIICGLYSAAGGDGANCRRFLWGEKVEAGVGAGCASSPTGSEVEDVAGQDGAKEMPFSDLVYDYFEIKKVEVPEIPDVSDIQQEAEASLPVDSMDSGGDNDGVPQIPDECFVDPQVLISEGAIDFDPSSIIDFHDGDTFSDGIITYRLRWVDTAEVAGSDGTHCWFDQHGIGEYSDVNYGQLGKEYVEDAFEDADQEDKYVQILLGNVDNYGRQLAAFVIDGQLLPCLLVKEGLAWENVSYYYKNQMDNLPPLPQIVFDASEKAGDPNFEQPYKFKGAAPKCQ